MGYADLCLYNLPRTEQKMQQTASACRVIPGRIDSGRDESDTDKMYNRLMVLGAKANCDTQYDPPTKELFTDYTSTIRTETAKFLFVLALGLTGVTLWRSVV
jgi:hypothetical protein